MKDSSSNVLESNSQSLLNSADLSEPGLGVLQLKHRLHEDPAFSDEAMLELLDRHSRRALQAFTMGNDPRCREDWRPVDTTGVTAKELLSGVASGRFWLNVLRIENTDHRYREVVDRLFSELSRTVDGFQPERSTATLILSSPGALVYYHADAQPNLLWQIRGEKDVWVYPAGNRELVPQEYMEDIFANYADEEIPYDERWDALAKIYRVAPGCAVSWPQNAPHRVVNRASVNISLSTPFETEKSYRRKLTYCSNRFFRRKFGLPFRSTGEVGIFPTAKRLAYRVCFRAGLVGVPPRRAYITRYRMDPASPNRMVELEEPTLTEFSAADFRLDHDESGRPIAVPL
jgi:hypothetical protein